MDHQRCNIFRNVYDRDCSNVVHTYQIIDAIKNGRWSKQIESFRNETDSAIAKQIKYNLPCFIVSGVFKERNESGLEDYSYLLIADIDNLSKSELSMCKAKMIDDPCVMCFFESPSKGLKVIVSVNTHSSAHKEYAFPSMKKYLESLLGVEVDPSGKDICRLCFVSYDPGLYFNPSAIDLDVDVSEPAEYYSVQDNDYGEPSFDLDHVYKVCVKMIKKSKVGGYFKGNRNNFVFCLASLCSEAGIPEHLAFAEISKQYTSLGKKEISNAVRSAFKRTRHKFGTKVITKKKSQQTRII